MQSKQVAVSTTNKLVYISRVEARFSERDIMDIIYNANIGRVEYADMTAVRDNSPDAGPNPAFKFYSAFVMMSNWNPDALSDLMKFGQVKVWVDAHRSAFWLLRPAKEGSEIPRSKVNTHQLAHYTAELYKRMEAAEKRADEQAKIIEDQSKIIEHQNERIAHMLEMMEKVLTKNEELENKIVKTEMIVSYMDSFMTSRFAEDVVSSEDVVIDAMQKMKM